MQDLLERNLNRVREDIRAACADASRDPEEVRIIAVTKKVSPEVALALHELGQLDFGESRLEGLEAKHAAFEERGLEPTWHFVGHLQRNKAARVVRLAHEIHSVDSLALLDAIDRHASHGERVIGVYLQVLLADEEAKHGFLPSQLVSAVDRAAEMDHVDLLGLMTMAPLVEDDRKLDEASRVFEQLTGLADELPALGFAGGTPLLSMGMSGDFREAIAAGADLVRVGSALFEGLPGGAAAP